VTAYVGFQHVHIVIGTQQSNLLGSPPGESDFVDRVESLHFLMEDVSVSGVECGCVGVLWLL